MIMVNGILDAISGCIGLFQVMYMCYELTKSTRRELGFSRICHFVRLVFSVAVVVMAIVIAAMVRTCTGDQPIYFNAVQNYTIALFVTSGVWLGIVLVVIVGFTVYSSARGGIVGGIKALF